MSLPGDVMPAVLTMLTGLTAPGGGPLLKGVSEGSTLSIPQSPWCWVENSSFSSVPAGSDLESTPWEMLVRLLHEWAPDQWNAEHVLSGLIEPIRAAVRAHIKLGTQSIATAYVYGGQWGYISVNDIWYRNVDLTLRATEKRGVTYGA